jgi:hypothetical protein
MSISYNFGYLPDSVLTLSGYDFSQFIKNTLDEAEAELLNKISIQTTSSFLSIEDPLEIFNYDIEDDELQQLKEKLSFKSKNKKVLIKPGVISAFRSLRQGLKDKADQQLAQSKKKQRRQLHLSNINPVSLSLPVMNVPGTNRSTVANRLSLVEHKAHVQKLISKWCSENKDHLGFDSFNLEENIDFILNIEFDENSIVKGNIKCKCNKSISLGNNDDKLQISNFYKHLQSAGCDHMKNMKKNARISNSIQQQQQQQQSSMSVPFASSSPPHSSPVQIPSISVITTETVSHEKSPISSNESVRGSKRRLVSQSQQNHSAKRNRL